MGAKHFVLAGAALILIVVLGLSIANLVNANYAGSNVQKNTFSDTGEVQIVTVRSTGLNYVLEPAVVKKDVKVRLVADIDKLYGCARDLNIPAFKVSHYFTAEKKYVEFMPNKEGTFNIACSMGMHTGKITVTADGTGTLSSNAVVETPIASTGGSCGASGGGCGCGVR